jgi:hypothetical protein
MNAKMFVPKRLVLTLAQFNKPKKINIYKEWMRNREQSAFKLPFPTMVDDVEKVN